MKNISKTLELLPPAKDAGVIVAKGINIPPDKNIVYLKIDPEKEDLEFLKKEAKEFWLLYSFPKKEDQHINDPTPEKTMA